MKTLLCALIGISLSGSAWAERCKPFHDREDRFSFGKTMIGEARKPIPPSAPQSENCRGSQKLSDFCVYVDTDGVTYFVDDKIVVRKEIRDIAGYRGSLIAGVADGDVVAQVTHKLDDLPWDFPSWHIETAEGNNSVLVTDVCVLSGNGTLVNYELEFDWQDRLIGIASSSQLYWQEYWETQ